MYPTDQLFCNKRRFKFIEYGLNETIRIKKKEVILILYSSLLSTEMNFQTIVIPKLVRQNILIQKAGQMEPYFCIL